MTLCLCGCGQTVTPGRRFMWGHSQKGTAKPKVQGPLSLCECGCGRVVNHVSYRFMNGHGGKYNKPIPIKGPLQLCACGCGGVVTRHKYRFNRFIKGHGARLSKAKLKYHRIYEIPETSTDNVDFCKMCNSKDMLFRRLIAYMW